jgi:hypothetical protein
MRHFIFSEEITRCFIFFTAELTLAGVLRLQAQVPHYFLRKKWRGSLFLKKKWGASLFVTQQSENNEVLDFFTAEITLAGLSM